MTLDTQFKMMTEKVYSMDKKPSAIARCSSLSKFCPVAFAVSQIQGYIEESMSKDFYCEIGTATHSVVQKWLGISGFLYGHWVCSKCGRHVYEGFGPFKHCDEYCTYEEYQLQWDILSGHCDGILMENDEFYVLELKTISLSGLNIRVKEDRPYEYHEAQANFYTFMGQKLKLPKSLVGYVIVYIARDNPNKFKVFKHKGVNFNKIKETVKLFKETQIMLQSGVFENITKYCTDAHLDTYCPYRSICTRNDISKALGEMFCHLHI